MSLIVNGTEIENVIYNGTELTELVFNGVKVWEKILVDQLSKLIDGTITEVTAEDLQGITTIGNYAFANCLLLKTVSLPNSVTIIEMYAFQNCKSLIKAQISNNLTTIGNYAFSECTFLSELTIPNSVTSIGNSAFYSCSALTTVTIPNSVISIGDSAFTGCMGLTEITIPSSVKKIGNKVFTSSGITALALSTIRFEQPSGMVVSLPTAGSESGMLYFKNARAITVYTDNETIKNYDWAADNVTATILHLDGSAWA